MMNKDEIQPQKHSVSYNKCCGLVMNKDEIQQESGQGRGAVVVVW